ncbi:MAG: CoA transferase [Acidimicrobiales bacterium]|nr:CoA transferase [Acidimicrobiales bacterium]MCB1017644.1 CoA transferase [Acidimicrobiales bacterium]MCB9371969.1 CoA transferase [Microthrixaceae bacterium]
MTLEGYRVVELGVWVAGPSAGGLLADWGADVVKIEAPGGDPMRRLFAVLAGHGQTESPPFDLDNRGKRSVVLDLTTDDGREDARRLVATADVFLTNLRPEAVDRLGLGADDLLAANSRLVYASVTGYGRDGPDAHRAGYDVGAFWARAGIARSLVPDDEAPVDVRAGMGDHVTGLTILSGILAALLQRERTGTGQLVETSLLRTGIYCVGWDLGIRLRFGKLAPTQPRTRMMNPMVNCYRAADGEWFWLLGVESDRLWPKLVRALDRADLGEDERFATARARRHHPEECIAALDEVFATLTRDEWVERFDRHDVWWAPAHRPEDVLEDPQALAAGAFVDVPAGASGPAHRAVATPVTFSADDPDRRPGPVPALGEHTDEVRRELHGPDVR